MLLSDRLKKKLDPSVQVHFLNGRLGQATYTIYALDGAPAMPFRSKNISGQVETVTKPLVCSHTGQPLIIIQGYYIATHMGQQLIMGPIKSIKLFRDDRIMYVHLSDNSFRLISKVIYHIYLLISNIFNLHFFLVYLSSI